MVLPTGVVARFDPRRGYGFVIPDDGGEDVFVHQNNIQMDGFRYLKPGEHVSYELEVGEKGLKAVQVGLLDERPADDAPFNDQRNERRERDGYRPRRSSGPRGGANNEELERLSGQVDKLRRKQERLISLLVAKDLLAPGEIDGLESAVGEADADGVAADG